MSNNLNSIPNSLVMGRREGACAVSLLPKVLLEIKAE